MSIRVELPSPEALAPAGAVSGALRRGEALPCLPPLPRDAAGWAAAVQEAADRAVRPPSEYVDLLARRQVSLGAGAQAEANARALLEEGTVAVVTGQQPALLGGPLMTFHKAAGAIHLARRLDGIGGHRVIPVFWSASEDHDLDEVNRVVLLDQGGQVRKLSLDRRPDGRSLMDLPVAAEEAEALLDAATGLLPDTDRARSVCSSLAPGGETDFGRWGVRSLLALLGDAGLVIVEPPVLLPFAGPALGRLAREAAALRGGVAHTAHLLREAGLPAPIEADHGYVPLFVREEEGGRRLRVRADADGLLRLRDSEGSWTPEDLAAHLEARPTLGSGDAVGRVFVQNSLLPVLAYVGGPTELAYHAQVCAAHRAIGLPYPLAVPRPEATWLDAKAERAASAFDQTLVDVLAAGPSDSPPGHEDDDLLEGALDAWAEGATRLPPLLESRRRESGEGPAALERAVRRLRDAVVREQGAVRAGFARDRGTDAARWVRLQARLFPRGRPQERELSALSLVARHGTDAFRAGLAALDPLADGHHLIHLG